MCIPSEPDKKHAEGPATQSLLHVKGNREDTFGIMIYLQADKYEVPDKWLQFYQLACLIHFA